MGLLRLLALSCLSAQGAEALQHQSLVNRSTEEIDALRQTYIGPWASRKQRAGKPGATVSSTVAPRGSAPSGKWQCAKSNGLDVWQDENYGPVTATLNREEVLSHLDGKWLMIVGDSTVRMVYHLLLGILRWDWTEWPSDLNNHGPSYFTAPRQSFPSNCSLAHNLDPNNNFCLQDTLTNGVRLTFLWLDYADKKQLHPLVALQRQQTPAGRVWPRSDPDTLVLSMGAWHIRGQRVDDLQANLEAAMLRMDSEFPASHKIVTGTPNCNSNPEASTETTDRITTDVKAGYPGWVWFDRGSVTKHVCEGEHACKLGWPHPIGAPLNAVIKLLLLQVQEAGSSTNNHPVSLPSLDDARDGSRLLNMIQRTGLGAGPGAGPTA